MNRKKMVVEIEWVEEEGESGPVVLSMEVTKDGRKIPRSEPFGMEWNLTPDSWDYDSRYAPTFLILQWISP